MTKATSGVRLVWQSTPLILARLPTLALAPVAMTATASAPDLQAAAVELAAAIGFAGPAFSWLELGLRELRLGDRAHDLDPNSFLLVRGVATALASAVTWVLVGMLLDPGLVTAAWLLAKGGNMLDDLMLAEAQASGTRRRYLFVASTRGLAATSLMSAALAGLLPVMTALVAASVVLSAAPLVLVRVRGLQHGSSRDSLPRSAWRVACSGFALSTGPAAVAVRQLVIRHLTGLWLGAGALAALVALVAVLQISNVGSSLIAQQWLEDGDSRDPTASRRVAIRVGGLASAPVLIAGWTIGGDIVHALSGQTVASPEVCFVFIAVTQCFGVAATILRAHFVAVGLIASRARAQIIGNAVATAAAAPLIGWFALPGAAAAMSVAPAVTLAALVKSQRRTPRNRIATSYEGQGHT